MRHLSWSFLDWWLLIAVAVLFFLGLAALASVELSRGGATFIFLQKQGIAALLGIAVACFLGTRPVSAFRAYAYLAYLSGVFSLGAVLLFGKTLNGATGWFIIGGFAFQPVEWMKIALVLFLAHIFSSNKERRISWQLLGKCALIVGIPVALLLRQPDLGGAIILVAIAAIMIFFAGVSVRHIVLLLLCGVLAGVVGWFGLFADYQKERVYTFLYPTSDPLKTGYNVNQAKIAIGSGGLLGRGFAGGSQSQLQFLPESQSDFIFAVIAEEYGFIGSCFILGAYGLVLFRLLNGSRQSSDHFAGFLLVGGVALFGVQAAVHIGTNMAILPATGIALPFVSYGGSSLLMSFIALGILSRTLWEVRVNAAHIPAVV